MTRQETADKDGVSRRPVARWFSEAPTKPRPGRAKPEAGPQDEAPEAAREAARRMRYLRFFARFEALVEAIGDASHYGPSATLEAAYGRHRRQLMGRYPRIRRCLTPFLKERSADRSPEIGPHSMAPDTFEALFGPRTLEVVLRYDGGMLFERIVRAREALLLLGEQLRRDSIPKTA